jgi:large subunit ribosomal protein L6
MSRLAKKPITIPEKVTLKVDEGEVSVKGPLGELARRFRPIIKMELKTEGLFVTTDAVHKEARALLGTTVAHIKNMINGVVTGFAKKLMLEGIGFKAEVKGTDIVLNLGFSHQVKVPVPKGLKVTVEKNVITISGVDTESVGQFAAKLRSLKKPEPYKGKGIRYEGEVVKLKPGKKTA